MLVFSKRLSQDSHLSTDTDRLMNGVYKLLSSKMGDSLSIELVGEAGVISQASNGVGDISFSAIVSDTLMRRRGAGRDTHLATRIPFPPFKLSTAASLS
jgi:hypothetical protein